MKTTTVPRKHSIHRSHWRRCFLVFPLVLLEIVQTIAKHIGVNDINGLPIGQFLIQKQREITEDLVADFADTFPAQASQIKAALEDIEREQGYSPLG